jgi:hypothetical protein
MCLAPKILLNRMSLNQADSPKVSSVRANAGVAAAAVEEVAKP